MELTKKPAETMPVFCRRLGFLFCEGLYVPMELSPSPSAVASAFDSDFFSLYWTIILIRYGKKSASPPLHVQYLLRTKNKSKYILHTIMQYYNITSFSDHVSRE
jgi:hypothetical protein